MSTIAGIAVNLSANISAFAGSMSSAAGTIGTIRGAFDRATDSAAAYKSLTTSIPQLKLAGSETVASVQTAMAVARSELQRFARNTDVQVAIEIGREYLDEAWIKARPILQNLADRSGIKVAAAVVADRTQTARAWVDKQRQAIAKPIMIRAELARRAVDDGIASVRGKLDSLKQYRAVRITLAAVNATKLPIQAAIATLGPLRKLATAGVIVALKATHLGVAVAVTKARALLGGLAGYGKSVASSLTGSFMSIGGGLASMAAVGGTALAAGLGGVIGYSVKLAADAEQARVSFTTMLGSVDKANDLLGQINDFAAATPFQTPELIDASKKLLAFGVDAQSIIPTMRSLGDIAAGLGIPIGDLSELYGKAKVQGRLFAEDVNQLTGRGIPVIAEFAKQFGVAESEVKGLVESGQINFGHFQKAMASLSGEGGKFSGLMAAQSGTVSGLFSTLSDTVTMSLTKIGTSITEGLDLRGALGGITTALSALSSAALPVIEAFIGRVTEGGNVGQRAGELVLNASEMIATGLAYGIDYSKLLVVGFKSMQSGAALAIGGLLKAVDLLGGGLVDLLNLLPGVDLEWTSTIGAMADGVLDESRRLGEEAAAAWDSFDPGSSAKGVGRFFEGVRAQSQATAQQVTKDMPTLGDTIAATAGKAAPIQAVTDALKGMREEVAGAGLGGIDTEIAKLQKLGATDAELAQARGLLTVKDQIDGLSKVSSDDPLGDYAQKLSTITQLWGNQKIGLGQFNALKTDAATTLNEKLSEQAKSVVDSVKTPLDAYNAELQKLQTLLDKGFITQDVFDAATAKAQTTLDSANQQQLDASTPKALRAGSADAQRLAYDASRGMQKTLGKDDIAKKSLSTQESMARTLTDIARSARADRSIAVEEVAL